MLPSTALQNELKRNPIHSVVEKSEKKVGGTKRQTIRTKFFGLMDYMPLGIFFGRLQKLLLGFDVNPWVLRVELSSGGDIPVMETTDVVL